MSLFKFRVKFKLKNVLKSVFVPRTSVLVCLFYLIMSPEFSFAIVNVDTVKMSWADLVPSQEELHSGSVYILQSLEDYVDFDIRRIKTSTPDFQKKMALNNCLKRQTILILNMTCLNLLRTQYVNEFNEVLREFVTFYDEETPSYFVQIKSSEFKSLLSSTVLVRLNNVVPQNQFTIDPVSLLNSSVYSALWTVPTNEANCFGTAYTAVTPNARLRYRDYLWSTKSPAGFDRFNINDDLIFGDIIEFEISGDGHAIVYLGTDQEGDMIVLTKNGFMPSVVQVMKYEDVYKIYEYYGILNVNVWRYNSNSANGFAGNNPNFDIDFLDSIVNSRKNSVELSMDQAMLRSFAKKWNDRLSKRN